MDDGSVEVSGSKESAFTTAGSVGAQPPGGAKVVKPRFDVVMLMLA